MANLRKKKKNGKKKKKDNPLTARLFSMSRLPAEGWHP
jgi:hypothetical protein